MSINYFFLFVKYFVNNQKQKKKLTIFRHLMVKDILLKYIMQFQKLVAFINLLNINFYHLL